MAGLFAEEPTASRRQKALIRLALIEPIQLSYEAKVERCRATRDLRRCGHNVQSVLVSCGHAALCDECCRRCEICPICRIPLPKGENKFHPRLHDECMEAGLISKTLDDRLNDIDDADNKLIADVQRLYSLFDVAIENNLVCLICHYVTDVCMDERALSSDPVMAFLLDGKVIKDWCMLTFKSLLADVKAIYKLTIVDMKRKLDSLMRISSKLEGMSNVLEVLESSFKGSLTAMLQDLNNLQECILKTKQHAEIMMWCIRHEFLANVRSRHHDFISWQSSFRERKLAAKNRAWPYPKCLLESSELSISTLFIEDALRNLDANHEHADKDDGELAIQSLLTTGKSSFVLSEVQVLAGCYPFENILAGVDLLFLRGNSDLVVAKQAIFLYFLFDRHWTMPAENWRYIVDDFAVTFSISRHSLLESFVFYLLDDHTDEALKEATRLLPEIAGRNLHPKIARALLERQNPDAALMVLHLSGRDWEAAFPSLEEAVTALRIRIECGHLTEAFMYQRRICTKVKDKELVDTREGVCRNWTLWLEVLVSEYCYLCNRRNLVSNMIELPWNSDEEKHLHSSLFHCATEDPSSSAGNLLVVFYLQRHRYIEAYHVDSELKALEEKFILESRNEVAVDKVRSVRDWRKKIVDQGVGLLPEFLQQQLKHENMAEVGFSSGGANVTTPPNSYIRPVQEPVLGNMLFQVPNSRSEGNGFTHNLPQP